MINLTTAKNILKQVTAAGIIAATILPGAAKVNAYEVTTQDSLTLTEAPKIVEEITTPVTSIEVLSHLVVKQNGATSYSHYLLSSDVVKKYKKGTKLVSTEQLSNGWYLLEDGSYLSKESVEVQKGTSKRLYLKSKTNGLVIRTKPNATGKIVKRVNKGDLISAVAIANTGWYKLADNQFVSDDHTTRINTTVAGFDAMVAKDKADKLAKQKAKELAKQKALEAAKKKKASSTKAVASKGKGVYASIKMTAAERELLARLIYCEANVEPYKGQVGVAQVIFNRMLDPRFPNTVTGVISAKGQFVPYGNGKINRITPNATNYKAIDDALVSSNLGGAVYFHDPRYSGGRWWNSLTTVANIGHHSFKK